MSRPRWLAPAVKPGASDVIRSLPGQYPLQNTPGQSVAISGNSARQALFPWALMPENQPWTQPDITAQQPYNLRRARSLSPAFARGIPLTVGGGIDWLALLQALYDEALAHIDDKVNVVQQPFNIGAAPVSARPEESRRYLFILNTSAANNLFIGFGAAPTGAVTDFFIPAGGFYEPTKIPQNEIFLLGAGANTRGQLLYAN
jgi:hypothetical protein